MIGTGTMLSSSTIRALSTAVVLAVCLTPISCNLIPILRGGVFSAYEDALGFALPRFCFAADAFSRGDTLQWFPAAACGLSSSGEGAGGLLLPTAQIFCRLFSGPVAYQLDVVSAQLAAFVAMLVLLRHRRFSWRICAVGACFYAFCPMGLATRTSMNWVYAAMPLMLAGIEKMASVANLSNYALLAASILLILLSGHPPLVAYAAIIALCHVTYCSISQMQTWRLRLAFVLRCAACGVFAGVISLPLWIPVFVQLGMSDRVVNSADAETLASTVHVHPEWFRVFLTPFYAPWYTNNHWQEYLRLPVLLIIYCGFSLHCRRKSLQLYQLIMLAAILLIAMGPLTPLWKIIHSFPIIKYFRYPFRWLFFCPLFVSPLAASGIRNLYERTGTIWPRLTTAAGVVLFWSAWEFRWLSASDEVRWMALASTFGMAFAVLLLSFERCRSTAVAAGVGFSISFMLSWGVSHQLDPSAVIHIPTADQRILDNSGDYRVCLAQPWYRPWSKQLVSAAAVPDVSAATGLRSAQYSGSNIPYWSIRVQERLWKYFSGDDALVPFAQICAIRYVYSSSPLVSKTLRLVGNLPDGTYFYELIRPVRRARIVPFAEAGLSDSDVIERLASGVDITQTVLISEKVRAAHNHPSAVSVQMDVNITGETNGRITLQPFAELPAPAWLVLADTWYPGWRCEVDGAEVEVHRANYCNRAVLLPAGAKIITFEFVPLVPDWLQTIPSIVLLCLLGVSTVCFIKATSGNHG